MAVLLQSAVHPAASADDPDVSLLQRLGYKQELKRALSTVGNVTMSFAVMGVLVGVTSSFITGLQNGGTLSMTVGWLVAAPFNACVALAMAEICSAFPTSGGLYYWSSRLAGDKWGPLASWMTGWFNIVGLWVGLAAAVFANALMIQAIIVLSNGGAYTPNSAVLVGIMAFIFFSMGLFNCLSISWLSLIAKIAATLNVLGIVGLIIVIPSVATTRASPEQIFTSFYMDVPTTGIDNKFYVFVLGLLMTQYSIAGYDAAAHMTEETKNAAWSGSIGIISAVGLSTLFGWIYIVGIASTITDVGFLLDPENDAGGYPIGQLFYSIFKARFGNGIGGIICLGYIAVTLFISTVSWTTTSSRMTYAFSRDGALPLSKFWHRLNKQEVPLNAVWLCVTVAFCITLLSLVSQVAFNASASILACGLYITYVLPTFFRITIGRKSFVPGPFNLGRLSVPIGSVAVVWVTALVAFFSLPAAYPVTSQNFNYTPVAVGGLLFLTTTFWLLSGRHWFKGPVRYVDVAPY